MTELGTAQGSVLEAYLHKITLVNFFITLLIYLYSLISTGYFKGLFSNSYS